MAIAADAEGLTERLIEANEGRELDLVLDSSGGAVFDASIKALAPFGRIVVNGIATGEQNEVRTGSLLRHSRSVIGFYLFHSPAAPRDVRRGARGPVRARADGRAAGDRRARPTRSSRPPQAQIDLRARRTTGKLLLDPTA